MKTIKDCWSLYLKCDILLLIDMFRNNINKYLEITSNRIMDYVQVIISAHHV